MKHPLRLFAFVALFLLALPAFASIWVTNRTEKPYDIEIKCRDAKATEHHIEGNTSANYSLAKKSKSCQIVVKDAETKSPLSQMDAKDGAQYEINEGGKLSKR